MILKTAGQKAVFPDNMDISVGEFFRRIESGKMYKVVTKTDRLLELRSICGKHGLTYHISNLEELSKHLSHNFDFIARQS